ASSWIVAVTTDRLMDCGAKIPPTIQRSFQPKPFNILGRSIQCHPCHHLGIGKLRPFTSRFPNPFVRTLPDRLQTIDQSALQAPCGWLRLDSSFAGQVHPFHDLTVQVELKLPEGLVSDVHRLRAVVAW